MAQDGFTLKGDKNLEKDLSKCTSYEDIRALLENATVRSGIATRNPDTGRFERSPLTPAAQVEPTGADQGFKRTVNIGGTDFIFEADSELELERAINDANAIADAARQQSAAPAAPAQRVHHNPPVEVASAVESALTARGFDVDRAAADQFSADWASATEKFLHSAAGADWPGGERNREVLGLKIAAMGLLDAADKSSAIAAAWAEMKKGDTVFDVGPSEEQILAASANLSPTELLEQWKAAHGGDSDAANAEFMRSHSSTGSSSSLFGKG